MNINADTILEYIFEKNTFQKKKLGAYFEKNSSAKKALNTFLDAYLPFIKQHDLTYQELCDSYLLMNEQMMHSRVHFLKTGTYPKENQSESIEHVYENETVMTKYMFGLALSQFLWEHHFKTFLFLQECMDEVTEKKAFLEVGSGHGLFLSELLKKVRTDLPLIDVVDISSTSLKITKSIIKFLYPKKYDTVNFHNVKIEEFVSDSEYDFIIMGEVLEHVEDPISILKSLKGLIREDGRIFISTCSNCPAIDHIYQFNNIEEIRQLIGKSGLKIAREAVIPSENVSEEKIEKYKLDIMYAAILVK